MQGLAACLVQMFFLVQELAPFQVPRLDTFLVHKFFQALVLVTCLAHMSCQVLALEPSLVPRLDTFLGHMYDQAMVLGSCWVRK